MADTKREKINHEMPLIQCFKLVITSDATFGIKNEINIGNDSAACSDIEYISNSDEYLIIEAKSHESKDAYNTRHKIFGQLLKEHGKTSASRTEHNSSIALGVLIPKDKTSSGKSNTKKSGYDFYRDGYSDIPENLFSGFGKLAKVKYVFLCSVENKTVDVYTWVGFHRGEKPIHSVQPPSASTIRD
ncbi:MAG: hypothetical protein CO125_09145 [Hydrogenophilales bacterium CG_4_9_14_3_um_filter_59_35]|nr:MAG: hypothetical protein COZ23_11015 [Hydrogenophilales bacterium CG_4_10_14_3_um_filter_58_23]PJB05440.1 MAG: hypothetical protein CO125_09145 [Hydrogenophilales bacterium CG_4_9_14_3_um_filter_59_35]